MGKSIVCEMQVRLVQPRNTQIKRAIQLTLKHDHGYGTFLIGEVPGHWSYMPTAHRKLRELLEGTVGAWVEPNRRYPVNGTFGLIVPFAIWYEERDRSIHITAPPAKTLHLRLVDRTLDTSTQVNLYQTLYEILDAYGKIPASVYA